MKNKLMIPMLALALAFAACSSETPTPPANGSGKLSLRTALTGEVAEVIARAQSNLPNELIPQEEALQLHIEGSYTDKTGTTAYNRTWTTLSDFRLENPDFEAGDYSTALQRYNNRYTASLSYGNPAAEGEGKAAFAGQSEEFSIYAGNTANNEVRVPVKLVNSCFTFAVGEWLLNYFTDVAFTIHTAQSDFEFCPTTTTPSALIFVQAGQPLSFSGTAVKKQTGVEVRFPKTTLGAGNTAPQTKYAITVEYAEAGGGALRISFNDSFTEVEGVDVELNPDEN